MIADRKTADANWERMPVLSASMDDLDLEEVRKTVVHEIAHYFGMDEDQVDDMGYA